jgi:DNA-3-methyladenine glycosylase II
LGIGRWTAEIYLMFSLKNQDIFPCGDLALQEATRIIYSLPERPKEKELREMSLDWKPYRSLAALVLWEFYAKIKRREGI